MIPALASLATLAVATVTDVRTRRIPNAVSLGSVALAVAFHAFAGEGAGFALAGAGVGGLCLLAPFLLGGMGGGDVKLLASLGAWLGPASVVVCFAYAALAGAVLSLALVLVRRLPIDWRAPLDDLAWLAASGERPAARTRQVFPYSLAIATGCAVFLAFGVPL